MDRKEYRYYVEDEKENFYKIDLSLFIISLFIVFSKAVIGYWSLLPSLSDSTFIYDFSQSLLFIPFNILLGIWFALEWLVKPILIGLMMSFLTWQMIYIDSTVPGVRPPTPFTYKKHYCNNRLKLHYRYHLCYIFAIAMAPLTTISLLIADRLLY